MKTLCEKDKCTGCGACAEICSVSCIEMKENEEGFLYPCVDEEKCLSCHRCDQVCNVLQDLNGMNILEYYYGWSNDSYIRGQSSSGGIFSELAKAVLNDNGIVFGAYLDYTSRQIRHIGIEKYDDLSKVRKSKYYQGVLNGVFSEVEHNLKEDREVLFSGTSCQVAALHCYLGKEYNNLITIDMLCHGVTSKKVVDELIKSEEKMCKKKIVEFAFRVKPPNGVWKRGGGARMIYRFDDGKERVANQKFDMFFLCYNENLILRESCYKCKYIGINRVADITLADFWGIDSNLVTKEDLEQGISLMLANSEQGKKLLERISNDITLRTIDDFSSARLNIELKKNSRENEYRSEFFKKVVRFGFRKTFISMHRRYLLKTACGLFMKNSD